MHPDSSLRKQAIDDAAAWYARLTCDDVESSERAAFVKWRAADPQNERALRHLLETLGRADAALASLASGGTAHVQKARTAWPRALLALAASIAAVTTAAVILVGIPGASSPYEAVTTAVGKTGTVDLPDGSRIYLNTDTQLRYEVDQFRRHVRLAAGEAYFDIASDESRPFVISVGDHEVRVVGTAFNIRHVADRTDVAVSEGRVKFVTEPGLLARLLRSPTAVVLTPGMQISSHEAQVTIKTDVNVSSVASWRHGQLVYRGQTLSDVMADLDRYFEPRFVVDPAAAGLKVSAVINLGDLQTVLDTLSRQLLIRATPLDADTIGIARAVP
jgi:transmembrane sensor